MPLIITILLWIVIILSVVLVSSVLAHIWVRGVPYVPSKARVIKEMIKLADLKSGQTVFDLGAGDGRVLIEAKKECPGITAIGVELVPTVWLYGRLRIWLSKAKISFWWGDAFYKDLRSADVVFLYLFPDVLKKFEKKFDKELRPGTRVISNAFEFKDREPVTRLKIPCGKKMRKVFVYEW